MAKIEFSKAEKAVSEGLLKLTIDHLLEIADYAQLENSPDEKKKFREKRDLAKKLIRIRHDLNYLSKQVHRLYGQMKLKKSVVQEILEKKVDDLSPKDGKILKQIARKLQEVRAELPKVSDDELVELERKKHINKRFNVNDKWLPLK